MSGNTCTPRDLVRTPNTIDAGPGSTIESPFPGVSCRGLVWGNYRELAQGQPHPCPRAGRGGESPAERRQRAASSPG